MIEYDDGYRGECDNCGEQLQIGRNFHDTMSQHECMECSVADDNERAERRRWGEGRLDRNQP